MSLMAPKNPPVVGTHEIGEMLGVSRQRVFQITSRKDFPRPYAEVKAGKLWRRAAVEQWAHDHGRDIGDDGGPSG
jgi:prophage regulatory protein